MSDTATNAPLAIERFQSREAWLEARRSGIGGTDAVAILGHSSWRSPYTVYAEKKLDLPDKPGDAESEAMLWGRVLEEPVRAEWERRSKLIALPTPLSIVRDPEFSFLFASPDALVDDDAGLEIKTASEWKNADWSNEVPLGYQIQMQHYLMVTGRERWHVAALIGGQKLVCATVERNEDFIKTLRESLVEWWALHIIGDERPAIDGSDSTTETIKRVFPPDAVTGEIVTLSDDWFAAHEDLVDLKAEAAAIDARVCEIENRLKVQLGNAVKAILPGGLGSYTLKPQHRKSYTVAAADFKVLRYSKKGE